MLARRLAVALALALPVSAVAVPTELVHQGRLFDGSGVPLDGDHDLSFTLYDDPASGANLWSETLTAVPIEAGYFSVTLGGSEPLDDTVFDGDKRYLEISVDGGPALPTRVPVVSVPYAIRARTATNVEGGVVDVTEVRIDGNTVIDSTGAITGTVSWDDLADVPADLSDGTDADALGALTGVCTSGEVPTFDGTGWQCGPNPADHDHDAADVTTGTLDINRLPVGSGASEVAAGDHVHTASDITGGVFPEAMIPSLDAAKIGTGTLDVARLPVGDTASDVASGDHSHDGSTIQLGDSTATCDSSLAGTLRWDGTQLAVCTGFNWTSIASSNDGSSPAAAATSCAQLHADQPGLGSGYYWLDPDGGGAVEAYCDMVTDGGGWTLCFAYDTGSYDSANWPSIAAARNKVLAKEWGASKLHGNGTTQGNFCNRMDVTANTSELIAEVVRRGNSDVMTTGIYTLAKNDFFTQTHTSSTFDCLGDRTGTKRFIYANYTSPRETYNNYMLTACSSSPNKHTTETASTNGAASWGIDGALINADDASGANAANELSTHVNWYANVSGTLYTNGSNATVTKFGTSITWTVNGYGRSGQSPGLNHCWDYCGHTNTNDNVMKQRLWLR